MKHIKAVHFSGGSFLQRFTSPDVHLFGGLFVQMFIVLMRVIYVPYDLFIIRDLTGYLRLTG
jgi:hypothetical protein